MDQQELKALLDFAVRIAGGAGEICMKYFRRASQNIVAVKTDGSFVTRADREAEEFLREQIRRAFPDDGIIGEEFGVDKGVSDRNWILDPIDGTFSFIHGVPLFGVLIGLEVNNEPVLGVVDLPALDETIYAARGRGCFCNGAPARVSSVDSLKESLLLTTNFDDCRKYGEYGFADQIANLRTKVRTSRTWGDCYGHVLVATGRAEMMLDPVMHIWDCAPLITILEEAGGRFTDWSGSRSIRGGNAISTNGYLYESVMREIKNTNQE